MSNQYATFEQVNQNKVTGIDPEQKKLDTPKGPVVYHEQKLFYNYGTPEDPIIQGVFVEGPLMKSSGIRTRDEGVKTNKKGEQYNAKSHSMMLVFDLADPDTKADCLQAITKLTEVYKGVAKALAPYKGKLGMHHFDPEHPEAMLKDPVYFHRNNEGEIVKGKNPNIWVKLRPWGRDKTLFTDMNGNNIDWQLLNDVDLEMIPLFHYESTFVGNTRSIRVYLASAIVTKLVPSGSETRQVSTLERLRAKYGSSKVDQVEAQIAEMRMNRQDDLDSVPVPNSTTEFGSDLNEGQVHDMPTESLQDFLGSAPTMNSTSQTTPQVQTLPNAPKLNVQQIN